MEFSITLRVETKRNDDFYFLSFSAFSRLFWIEMRPSWYLLNIFNFFSIFLEFSIMHRVGTERNDNFYFRAFSVFTNQKAWNEVTMVFFNFFVFFCHFFGIFYHASGKNRMEGLFLFSLFRSLFLSIFAWNEATMVFFNFLNFFVIFLEFSITHLVGMNRNDNF